MYSIVSLFSGCGGLDLGFHEEGFRTEYACDNFGPAVTVFRKNIDKNCYKVDVTSKKFHDDLKNIGRCDVILGGFPCQGFSKAGPKKETDNRNNLYLEMLKAVKLLKPKVFIAENVDGLSQNYGGRILEKIVEDFSNTGYRVEYRIIDMVWYGVPQHRRRIIFVGRREGLGNFSWPNPTHEIINRNGDFTLTAFNEHNIQKKTVTIKDAISDIQNLDHSLRDHRIKKSWPPQYNEVMKNIGEGQKLCNVRFSSSSVFTWNIPGAFGKTTKKEKIILETIAKNRRHKKYGTIPNGNPLPRRIIEDISKISNITQEIDNLLKLGYLKEKNDGYDLKGAMFCSGLFKRPKWNMPSQTVLTNFHNPRYFLHPIEPRPFSLRECARLQSFPDHFVFEEAGIDLIEGYKLVGNAVPPLFAKHLASSVKKFLNELTINST